MTRSRICWGFLSAILSLVLPHAPSSASDHADPMSANVFAVQPDPEANITDLHAFVVDGDGKLFTGGDAFAAGNRLVISLCVRRALRPGQEKSLDLKKFTFRVHLDLAPQVRFVDPHVIDGKEKDALAKAQTDLSMQSLYGGIITHPEDIVETAVLEFELNLANADKEPYIELADKTAWGLRGPTSFEVLAKDQKPSSPSSIRITTGLFDDPFIFPRFFRRNVVGVVTSIPMSNLMPTPPGDGPAPILLWATTHDGNRQIDHVGRSLRTQLPRFGHLNDKPPSEHVRAITRVHAEPTIMEAFLGSAVAPLFAHRHYDSVPDVMIYDLRKPARFPNGRWLEDDVSKTLADAGETLLLELSYAESREFPRATTNDKPFRGNFPYLADPWTADEVKAAEPAGSVLTAANGSALQSPFRVPRAADGAAVSPPNLDNSVWRKLFWLEVVAIALLTLALLFAVPSNRLRGAIVVVTAISLVFLWDVYKENQATDLMQPNAKIHRLVFGLGLIVTYAIGLVFALGHRWGTRSAVPQQAFPRDRQGPISNDFKESSYKEIHTALFVPAVSRPYYDVWNGAKGTHLPIYKTTFASVTAGLLSLSGKEFAMLRAARRTVRTHGDLRWGADRNGFRRLVHPMGVCLAGTWKIEENSPYKDYTGYFQPGAEGRVIARYSLGGNQTEGGHNRSLGLAGKLFPLSDAVDGSTRRAHFITQEDLGGAFTNSVTEAILTNAPPVTLHKRGSGLFAFIPVIAALMTADKEPAERQLYEVAELGKPEGEPTVCPRFMRLQLVAPSKDYGDEGVDFRNEILGMMYDAGNREKQRDLEFTIEVSESGKRTLFQKVTGQEWTVIGKLVFHEAAASYNGDFVIHFHHPVWRRDRNDPDSIARRDLRDVSQS